MTSVLAIAALLGGSLAGWRGLDPAAGLVGAAVILAWAIGLARRTAGELMDMTSEATALRARVNAHLEGEGDVRVEDIRVWPLGGGAYGCTIMAITRSARSVAQIKSRILAVCAFGHLAVELHPPLGAEALDQAQTSLDGQPVAAISFHGG
jgi:Co/Zn/Cd efflux system component